MPALDRALELLAAAAPCRADTAALILQGSGVATAPFHPASVLSAAELCGREAPFQLEDTAAGTFVVTERAPAYRAHLVGLASAHVSRFGAASLSELTGLLAAGGIDVLENHARDVLRLHAEAQFLDEDWFWFPARASRNRLAILTRRMLAVAEPLGVGTIRDGIARYSRRGVVRLPSETALTAFYKAHPDFRVDRGGGVRLAPPAERSRLIGTDRVLVEIFRDAAGGPLDRATLRDACLSRGMNRHTFDALMTRSPLLVRPAPNCWFLRGTPLEPGRGDREEMRTSAVHVRVR
jgi:hypothetical protein